mgnify:CR=1 FL=1
MIDSSFHPPPPAVRVDPPCHSHPVIHAPTAEEEAVVEELDISNKTAKNLVRQSLREAFSRVGDESFFFFFFFFFFNSVFCFSLVY